MKSITNTTKKVLSILAAGSLILMTFVPANASLEKLSKNAAGSVFTSDAIVREWNEIASTANAAAKGEVPFKARMTGSAAFTSLTTVEFHGMGQATHLGRFAASGVAVLGESTGICPGGIPNVPNVHTETLTAANGDELVIRMVNVGCPTGPYTFHGTGEWTVLGGTGRFRNATGQGTNEGNADFESNTFELALTGTLMRQ